MIRLSEKAPHSYHSLTDKVDDLVLVNMYVGRFGTLLLTQDSGE